MKTFLNISLSLVATLCAVAALELLARWKFPVADVYWPAIFRSGIGFTFQPDSEVRWSNFINFAGAHKVNSLGFLDREPNIAPKQQNEYRVLFIGDSYVEAAQVSIDQKFHVLVERMLQAKFIDRTISTMALGFSGTGTANELPFYTEIGRAFEPDLVVVVFAYNDFANNVALLESVRQGWSPKKQPRVSFEVNGNAVTRLPISDDWSTGNLPVQSSKILPDWKVFGDGYLGWSRLYRWGSSRLMWGQDKRDATKLYKDRIEFLRQTPDYSLKFEGWNYPEDLDFDYMFYADEMPPVFEDSMETTSAAFKELLEEVTKDGAQLGVLIDEACSRTREELVGLKSPRTITSARMAQRLQLILAKLEIPSLELRTSLNQRGIAKITFSHDIHWTSEGHAAVATALFPFIAEKIRSR